MRPSVANLRDPPLWVFLTPSHKQSGLAIEKSTKEMEKGNIKIGKSDCKYCGCKFLSGKDLEGHIARSHMNDDFACNLCKHTFKEQGDRKCHKENVHSKLMSQQHRNQDISGGKQMMNWVKHMPEQKWKPWQRFSKIH